MSQPTPDLPKRLLDYLSHGAPVLLLTVGQDGFPNTAHSWALATDSGHVRFGADRGSTTSANLNRTGRAALQIIGPGNLVFLIKGSARRVKERLAGAAFAVSLMELNVLEVKDQAWPQVTVTPLAYEWNEETRTAMQAMEQTIYAEMREGEADLIDS